MIPHEINQIIETRLVYRPNKKDKYGEVFTPITLIEELIQHIPAKWTKNPNTFILDPAAGIGNFTIVIYYVLMDSLEPVIPNKSTRSRHIIENMLYMIEIDKTNVSQCRSIFQQIDPDATPNIFHGDFLEDQPKWTNLFGNRAWNIIVANPPYQSKQTKLREGGYGGKTIWDAFLETSINLLDSNGYLAFITPPAWRKPDAELYHTMTRDMHLHFLHIYGKRAGQQWFKVQQRFDLYVLGKQPSKTKTTIIDEKGETHHIQTEDWPFIPNYAFTKIKRILTTKEKGIKIIYDRTSYGTDTDHMRPKRDATYKYPVVHSMNRNGIVYWYSNTKDRGHFGEPKVLLNFNEKLYPVLDYAGKYGMAQFTFGIPVKTKMEGKRLIKALESPDFVEIVKATKWGAFRTDWRMFCYFKPDFWKYFSNDERKTRKRGGNFYQQRKTRRVEL